MNEILKKFGKYFLLDHLAKGGMAEIYRARLFSPDAMGRLLVIKKIQAHLDGNNEFLNMFRSEIRVTLGFNHPNVVQVYDFGEEEGQPYIAMEWIDGKNLRQILNRCLEKKELFPVELSVYLISQAASGLHYAHSLKDKINGHSLNIIHRDISPQNILISFEGGVKVIDFGIAKTTVNSEQTRAGVIKGKPSYLSPEQISGDPLDPRSDLFSLGVVLWELLTGKKLFSGENDLAVLKQIEASQTHVQPPSLLNPKVSKELDYIVLKSLAKSKEKRYQSGDLFQKALHKCLYQIAPDFNPSDLGHTCKTLFKEALLEEHQMLQRLNEKADRLLASLPPPAAPPTVSSPPPPPASFRVKSPPPPPSPSAPPSLNPLPLPTQQKTPKPALVESKRSFQMLLLILGVGIGALGVFFLFNSPQPFFSKYFSFTQKSDSKIPLESTENLIPLQLTWTPGGGTPKLQLNSSPVSLESPLQVPLQTPLQLSLERPGFKPLQYEFALSAPPAQLPLPLTLRLEPEHPGFLNLQSTPSSTLSLFLEAEGPPWILPLPLERQKLPAGTFSAILKNEPLGLEKKISLSIQEGQVTSLTVSL